MKKIETFYTGGGIWLSEVDVDAEHYAVVSSDMPKWLSVYRKTEIEDEKYMPEDMVFCKSVDELSSEYSQLYTQMMKELEIHC